jgi:restriction endonuclease S subunit
MREYTMQTMKKIAEFFDDKDAALKLLSKYGEVLERNERATREIMDVILERHKNAYMKRQKNGTPNSLVIIENEIETESTEYNLISKDNLTGKGRVHRKRSLAQIEGEWGCW